MTTSKHILAVGTEMSRNGITYKVVAHEPLRGDLIAEEALYEVLVTRPEGRRKKVFMTLATWNLRAQQLEAL